MGMVRITKSDALPAPASTMSHKDAFKLAHSASCVEVEHSILADAARVIFALRGHHSGCRIKVSESASSTFPRRVAQLDEFQYDFMGLAVPRDTSARRIAIWATGGAPSVLAALCL